jgi:hypothetical protein
MWSWLIGFVGSRLKALVVSVSAAGALIAAAFFYGRRTEAQKRTVKDLKAYKDTRERIDEADINTDRDAAIDRLRDNDQLR